MLEDKIFENSFDKVEYGVERTTQASIQISPFVEKQYEESVSENIDEIYTRRRLMQLMYELYLKSEFFDKYGQKQHVDASKDASKDSSTLNYEDLVYNPVVKKVERGDLFKIYYHFKDELQKQHEFSIIQIFCTIAEFFDLNYKTLYNDILTLEDKVNILEHLEKEYGLDKHFARSKALF
jgi:hypothetical protein